MLTLVAHILCYDIWFYISHRLLHTSALYWIHKVHHEKRIPQFRDTYYDHWLESPIQAAGFLVPFLWMGPDTIQTTFALILINARGMLRHDERGAWIVGRHHLDHHLHGRGNYGDYWIDYVCGTCLPPLPNENPPLENAPQIQPEVLQEDTLPQDGVHAEVELPPVQELL